MRIECWYKQMATCIHFFFLFVCAFCSAGMFLYHVWNMDQKTLNANLQPVFFVFMKLITSFTCYLAISFKKKRKKNPSNVKCCLATGNDAKTKSNNPIILWTNQFSKTKVCHIFYGFLFNLAHPLLPESYIYIIHIYIFAIYFFIIIR